MAATRVGSTVVPSAIALDAVMSSALAEAARAVLELGAELEPSAVPALGDSSLDGASPALVLVFISGAPEPLLLPAGASPNVEPSGASLVPAAASSIEPLLLARDSGVENVARSFAEQLNNHKLNATS